MDYTQTARKFLEFGYSIIPLKVDGTKRPIGPWKEYQTRHATEHEVESWTKNGQPCAWAVVAGRISGGVHVVDFDHDGPAIFERFWIDAQQQLPGILKSLVVVATPRPGRQVWFRQNSAPPSSRTLAYTEPLPEFDQDGKPKLDADGQQIHKPQVLIETRGEGGYAVAVGSHPAVHPTGIPYQLIYGRFENLPPIEADQVQVLLDICRSYTRYKPRHAERPSSDPYTGEPRPGDIYNRHTNISELLAKHGWQQHHIDVEGVEYWTRPGKDIAAGYSATVGHVVDDEGRRLLYVFSSAATPFEPNCAYSAFSAFTRLVHGGDPSAAAAAARQIYTEELEAAQAEYYKQEQATPKEKDAARIECRPIPASQLGDGEKVDWIWHGYVARLFITLLVGLWKAGKSTLLAYLLRALASGGELVGTVTAAKALIITEEGSGLWARRRDEVGFGDHVHFDIRPFKCRPTRAEWQQYISSVVALVRTKGFDLVVIDTWAALNPCPDENDAADMMATLTPLHAIAECGAAILLVHHPRKGDASEGQASRGSGVLPGFVDTIIELRRFNAQEADDRRRKLRGHSRFDETPAEVVIELTDDGYKLVGSTGDANRADRQKVIQEVLADGTWRTADEILSQWLDGMAPKPAKRTLQLDLNHGHAKGQWQCEGKGTKGDKYRYGIAQSLGKGTVRETNSATDLS